MSTMQIKTSVVEFPTLMRPHIGLATRDVERSIAFYEQLFRQKPTKVRPGYAKFEVLEPPINLSLNLAGEVPEQRSPAHFGIQVKSTADVLAHRLRMTSSGFAARDEENVTCCYAVQDKVWFVDPDGHHWEVFVVTEADSTVHSLPAEHTTNANPDTTEAPKSACCAPTCCK
jgi:catechol 2,3-dioxygenase-like lactoylglutathione lyase family enzyme